MADLSENSRFTQIVWFLVSRSESLLLSWLSSVVWQCADDIEKLNDGHGHEKQADVPQSGADDDDEDVEEDEEEVFGKFTVHREHELPSQMNIQLIILWLCNLWLKPCLIQLECYSCYINILQWVSVLMLVSNIVSFDT